MSQKYFTTLTHIGAALHANAQLQQTTVPWTHLVLGDGNGVEPVPSPAQTGVIREVDRLAISSIAPDPDNPNWIVIEAVIPADRGGYVVRETALMGGANGNQCIAVGNCPSATKPLLSEGAGSELVIRVVVEIAHTATVTLKIDPAVVIASRDWVNKETAQVLNDAKLYADSAVLTSNPVGSIIFWPAAVAPAASYLKMNGAAISRTVYAKLFAVIGISYGAGDGATTFNLPDVRGEFPRFWSDGAGVDLGRAIGSKQLDALQHHNHGLPTGSGAGPSSASRWGLPDSLWIDNGAQGSNANPDTAGHANTWEKNAGGPNEVGRFNATETRPRNIAFMGLIKYE